MFTIICFNLMEEQSVVENDIIIYTLQVVFLLRRQAKLDAFKEQYNRHPLSTEGGKIPYQLWIARAPSEKDRSVEVDEIAELGIERNKNTDDTKNDENASFPDDDDEYF